MAVDPSRLANRNHCSEKGQLGVRLPVLTLGVGWIFEDSVGIVYE